jgi:hypothetical protein
VSLICERCGIGRRDSGGACDWCAAPARVRLPFWIACRRRLLQSALAANVRRRGALATGVTVGVVLHLLAAAVGVVFGLPLLWQAGFLWSQQWWWALVPEAWQPWLFAAVRGAAYGALAGFLAGPPSGVVKLLRYRFLPTPTPAIVIALLGFEVSISEVVFGWNPEVGLQYSLIVALLAGAVGRLTTLIVRGNKNL